MRILKLFLTLFLCLGAVTNVYGDARSRLAVSKMTRQAAQRAAKAPADGTKQRLYAPVIVEFDGDKGLEQLRDSLEAVILYTRQNMALTYIPRDKMSGLGGKNYVDRYSVGRTATRNCDVSRRASGISSLQAMQPLPYDGTGVVAGICDTGFDPEHIAFRDRLGMMSVYVDSLAVRRVWAPGSALDNGAELTTDNAEESHATHVMNILGGGFKGNPYYGGAPGAELAVSCSQLSDVALLAGIEDIMAYAREQGKPCVINLSVGEYLGPHDGTDLVNRYLDLLGQEALIVFSAGNNGSGKFGFRHTLGDASPGHSDGLPTVGTMFESTRTWAGHEVEGATDIWSHDDRDFDIRFVVSDQTTYRTVWRGPWYGPSVSGQTEGEFSFSTEDFPELAKLMTVSAVHGYWETDKGNGRFNLSFDHQSDTDKYIPGTEWARYTMGWEVRGQAGTTVDAYCDGVQTFMRQYGTVGMIDGSTDMSISNLCCGRAVLGVGAWNSRNTVPEWNTDTEERLGFEVDRVAGWSSYGTLIDGRRLPDICAPGNTVVSAMSDFYLQKYPETKTAYRQTVGGREYAWYEQCGTSMASPAAAAVLALWCQAYPQLDMATARRIITETARRDFTDIDDPRWGNGAIDAVAGLDALREHYAGVADITVDKYAEPAYFDLQGRPVTNPAAGLYIERRGTVTRKVIVR